MRREVKFWFIRFEEREVKLSMNGISWKGVKIVVGMCVIQYLRVVLKERLSPCVRIGKIYFVDWVE